MVVVCERDDARMVRAVESELRRGGQVLYVVPRTAMLQEEVALLRKALPPSTRIEFAHGDQPDHDRRIDEFRRGGADVLVATTVIECGLHIHCLNTIIIQDAVRTHTHMHAHAICTCTCTCST